MSEGKQRVLVQGAVPTSQGTETYYLYVGPDGGIKGQMSIDGAVSGSFSPQGLTTAGKITVLSIDDSTWWAAPVAPLANRNNISIQNQSTNGGVVLWNYSNTAGATEGMKITPGGERSVAITQDIPVYVRMVSGTGTIAIEELS